MKKLVKIISILFVVCIVTAFLFFTLLLDKTVKYGVELVGPQIIGVPVALEDVDISVLTGSGEITNLAIENPDGFDTEFLVKVDRARLDVDLKTLLSNKIVIEELIVEGPEFAYEMSRKGSNVSKILENLKRGEKDDAEKGPVGEQGKKSSGKKIQINLFRITDAKVRLQSDAVVLPMPDIELKDIGKESDGVSPAEAAAEIFSEVSSNIVNAASNIGGALKKTGSGIIKGIKGILSNDD
jgi:hypothetical protein